MGYSKALEQPQSSARPICHSPAMTRTGREPATICIAAQELAMLCITPRETTRIDPMKPNRARHGYEICKIYCSCTNKYVETDAHFLAVHFLCPLSSIQYDIICSCKSRHLHMLYWIMAQLKLNMNGSHYLTCFLTSGKKTS